MTVKIAVVGTGNVAQKNYLPYLAQQDDVELSYFNRTASKAEACVGQFGGKAAGSISELLSDAPDTVLILTGEMNRYEASMEVLEHGPKRVFFEKPLVAQQDQAHVTEDDFVKGREIMCRAAACGTETAMVFNYRFFDQTLKARALVEERGFGALVQCTALVHYACWSHCIDLVHAFGGAVAEITALSGRRPFPFAGSEALDVSAAFVTEEGASGSIIGTAGISFGFPLFEMVFSFERGRIHCRGLDGDMEVLDYGGKWHETFALSRQTSRWEQYGTSFEKSLAAYLDSIRGGTPPPVPGSAGLQELQFEGALKRSIRTGVPVDVQAEFPLDVR